MKGNKSTAVRPKSNANLWAKVKSTQSTKSKSRNSVASEQQRVSFPSISKQLNRSIDLESVSNIPEGAAPYSTICCCSSKIFLILIAVIFILIICAAVGTVLGVVLRNANTATTTTAAANMITSSTTVSTTVAATTTGSTTTTTLSTTTAPCFFGDDEVRLAGGNTKTITELRSGMKVYSMNNRNEIIEDEVIMILHRDPDVAEIFCVIETSDPRYQLSVTCDHYVAVSDGSETQYLISDHITPGKHFVYVQDDLNHQLQLVQVTNVIRQYKTGLYGLTTNEGTLIVNNIVASCYSNFTTIRIAHNVLGLFRLYYKLAKWFSVEEPFKIRTNGIPKPIKSLMDSKTVVIFCHDLFVNIVWLIEIELLVTIGYVAQTLVQKNIKTIGNFH